MHADTPHFCESIYIDMKDIYACRCSILKVRLHWAFLVRDSWPCLENSDRLLVDWIIRPIGDWNFPYTVMSHELKRLSINGPENMNNSSSARLILLRLSLKLSEILSFFVCCTKFIIFLTFHLHRLNILLFDLQWSDKTIKINFNGNKICRNFLIIFVILFLVSGGTSGAS